jgi:glycolate dehydrogenase FAD-binding subunit
MSAVADLLPLTETRAPEDQAALVALVAEAHEAGTPLYPIGGGTSLDYGLLPTDAGIGVSLTGLGRVVDYPARDMTITVEAGLTLDQLAKTLAGERQWLPVEAPLSGTATIGGLVATAFSGPRRYGYGTIRDYLIGITAVDGRGRAFKSGGRVVKNVAGYDFCKLLAGSLGTLGVISQVTLKIRPLPERSAFLVGDMRDFDTAERLLAALVDSATTPAAVELLLGPHWHEHPSLGLLTAGSIGRLVVGLEGGAGEVDWMLDKLAKEWRDLGLTAPPRTIVEQAAQSLAGDLIEFPAAAGAPLVLKASVLPSRCVSFIQLVRQIDPQASIQAHAGNGVVIARFSRFEAADVSRQLIGRLHPAARMAAGNAVVLSSTAGGLTHPAVWGNVTGATAWMDKVKRQFDPKDLLNRGRFGYVNL